MAQYFVPKKGVLKVLLVTVVSFKILSKSETLQNSFKVKHFRVSGEGEFRSVLALTFSHLGDTVAVETDSKT